MTTSRRSTPGYVAGGGGRRQRIVACQTAGRAVALDAVAHRLARALLALVVVASVHVAAPARAVAALRSATACASHCAKTRTADGCTPRCCVVAPDAPAVATVAPPTSVDRPAVALAVPLAPAALGVPLSAARVARLDVPRRAGPPVWLAVLTLRR
jgi:hypothetical protein